MNITITDLEERIDKAYNLLTNCRLCPRRCGIDRTKNEQGFCGAELPVRVYSYRQYLGEEPPISGTKGSGVIFFSHCTMRCIYCQNFRFSHHGAGYKADADVLCKMMLSLKEGGCHNINLVTPSHYLPAILDSLRLAKERSLELPIIYNTSGYESEETLQLLEGVVDIYLTDMRYSDNRLSGIYSEASDYVEVNRRAVLVMYKQVGHLLLNKENIAVKGLIIRHLVMPNLLSNTEGVLRYIAHHISKNVHISLMAQYLPLHKAKDFPEISRTITQDEYKEACWLLERYDLHNGWLQYRPFTNANNMIYLYNI